MLQTNQPTNQMDRFRYILIDIRVWPFKIDVKKIKSFSSMSLDIKLFIVNICFACYDSPKLITTT
jgi:hypothetical protein